MQHSPVGCEGLTLSRRRPLLRCRAVCRHDLRQRQEIRLVSTLVVAATTTLTASIARHASRATAPRRASTPSARCLRSRKKGVPSLSVTTVASCARRSRSMSAVRATPSPTRPPRHPNPLDPRKVCPLLTVLTHADRRTGSRLPAEAAYPNGLSPSVPGVATSPAPKHPGPGSLPLFFLSPSHYLCRHPMRVRRGRIMPLLCPPQVCCQTTSAPRTPFRSHSSPRLRKRPLAQQPACTSPPTPFARICALHPSRCASLDRCAVQSQHQPDWSTLGLEYRACAQSGGDVPRRPLCLWNRVPMPRMRPSPPTSA